MFVFPEWDLFGLINKPGIVLLRFPSVPLCHFLLPQRTPWKISCHDTKRSLFAFGLHVKDTFCLVAGDIRISIWNSTLLLDCPVLKVKLKVQVKLEQLQQVLKVKDERTKRLLFAVSLFTACRKHYKERKEHNLHQIPQDPLFSPQVVPLKT